MQWERSLGCHFNKGNGSHLRVWGSKVTCSDLHSEWIILAALLMKDQRGAKGETDKRAREVPWLPGLKTSVAQSGGVATEEGHSGGILGIREVRANSDFLMFGHGVREREK